MGLDLGLNNDLDTTQTTSATTTGEDLPEQVRRQQLNDVIIEIRRDDDDARCAESRPIDACSLAASQPQPEQFFQAQNLGQIANDDPQPSTAPAQNAAHNAAAPIAGPTVHATEPVDEDPRETRFITLVEYSLKWGLLLVGLLILIDILVRIFE